MTDFTGKNKNIHEALRANPDAVTDKKAIRLFNDGLEDRDMPEEEDSFEWACWVAGRRTRTDRGRS